MTVTNYRDIRHGLVMGAEPRRRRRRRRRRRIRIQ